MNPSEFFRVAPGRPRRGDDRRRRRRVPRIGTIALAIGSFFLWVPNAMADSLWFYPLLGVANPFDGVDVGLYSTPGLGDLDGDGDLDLFVGNGDGFLLYFENQGDPMIPVFVEQTGSNNAFDGLDFGFFSTPTLGDLDDDGDLDLLVSQLGAVIYYFENQGSATSPVFVELTGAANPFASSVFGGQLKPVIADLDDDDDLDVQIGSSNGQVLYFENQGAPSSPLMVEVFGAANPLDGVDVGEYAHPQLLDVDGDGDLDSIVGNHLGQFHYFRNDGDTTSPDFVDATAGASPLPDDVVAGYPALTSGDLNADGHVDLVIGNTLGELVYYVPEPTTMPGVVSGLALLSALSIRRR